jgi:hypothetical protein
MELVTDGQPDDLATVSVRVRRRTRLNDRNAEGYEVRGSRRREPRDDDGSLSLRINRFYGAIRTADDVPGYPPGGGGDGAPGAGTTLPAMS